jgi:hypothetical protein
VIVGKQLIIATWGIVGVVALLARALLALTPLALEPILSGSLGKWHWALLLVWVVTNAYAEGLVGFHQKFSPRTVDRALYLGKNPTFGRVLLGPAFCMGLFHATRRTKIVSWTLLVVVVSLVALMRRLAQPWRGIIDAGVVVGLAIGVVSLCWLFVQAVLTGRDPVLHEVDG